MNQEKYKFEVYREDKVYVFESEGPQGVITKVIQFSPINLEFTVDSRFKNLHNLGFGDYNKLTRTVDDKINSNNGDTDIVLATVAAAAIDFLRESPTYTLYAEGSTGARTRLYQMGINRFYDEIISDYDIWGLTRSKGWELFERNTNYQAFVMRKR